MTRSWEYDTAGNLKKAAAGGFCYTYEYRVDGKMLKKSSSGRTLISCTYFPDGNLESLTDVSGKTVHYHYGWKGELSSVTDEKGNLLNSYSHTPGGRLKEILHGNGLRTQYAYDTDGNIIRLCLEKENGEAISDLRYEYDLKGNRTLKAGSSFTPEGSLAELAVSYHYDRMDRLISENQDGEDTSYLYDLCGNRLKKLDKNGKEEYNYNQKNQLISRKRGGQRVVYQYDMQGNLLKAAGAEGSTRFSYNAFNQQTEVLAVDGERLENQYDAEYLRAGTIENGEKRTFLYYQGELIAEADKSEEPISRYILGYGVAAGWNQGREGYYSYHLDEQNSTAYILGADGEIENTYQYDAFGVLRRSREKIHNRILYTGQQYDRISGQYYLRARYYHPVVGRFLQEDVYRGDGLNLYAYCENNPVIYYDPSGYVGKEYDDGWGTIPPSQSGFNEWYNSVDLREFDTVWADESLRGYIEAQIRYPKTYHEWLMVARADTFKYWGVTMEDIKSNRSLTSQTSFINPTGRHGRIGSTTAYNEILDIIDSSLNYEDFERRLRTWADYRLPEIEIDGVIYPGSVRLPSNLQNQEAIDYINRMREEQGEEVKDRKCKETP